MDSGTDATPADLRVACTLDADDGAARLRHWQALAEQSPPRVQRNAHQLEIRWRLDADSARELEALVAAERECCAFVTWSVNRQEPDTILYITAEEHRPEDLAVIAALFTAS